MLLARLAVRQHRRNRHAPTGQLQQVNERSHGSTALHVRLTRDTGRASHVQEDIDNGHRHRHRLADNHCVGHTGDEPANVHAATNNGACKLWRLELLPIVAEDILAELLSDASDALASLSPPLTGHRHRAIEPHAVVPAAVSLRRERLALTVRAIRRVGGGSIRERLHRIVQAIVEATVEQRAVVHHTLDHLRCVHSL